MKSLFRLARMIEDQTETTFAAQSRRDWLRKVGAASATGIFLVGCGTEQAAKSTRNNSGTTSSVDPVSKSSDGKAGTIDVVADASVLNIALSLEHEAIAIYKAAAGLEWMNRPDFAPILAIAGTFLAHHEEHRDALVGAINDMKAGNRDVAAPIEAQPDDKYVEKYLADLTDFDMDQPAEGVKKVLQLASLKEMQAAQAYISVIPQFTDPELAKTSGMLGGDEAGHYGALRAALFAVLSDEDVTAETLIPAAFPSGWSQKFGSSN